MKALLEQLTAEVNAVTFASAEEVEQFRVAFLGRKGKLKDLMAEFKTVPGADKRELGPMLNAFKQLVEGGKLRILVYSGNDDSVCATSASWSRKNKCQKP